MTTPPNQPNPQGQLVTCARCGQRVTFTVDAVCSACRGGDTKKRREREEKR